MPLWSYQGKGPHFLQAPATSCCRVRCKRSLYKLLADGYVEAYAAAVKYIDEERRQPWNATTNVTTGEPGDEEDTRG